MKTIRLAVFTALILAGLGACASVEHTIARTDTSTREDVILTSPFHALGLADRDVTTTFLCDPECRQVLDDLPVIETREQEQLLLNAYPVGEKRTLSDGSTFQSLETWERPVEIFGMKMPTVFGVLCRPEACVLTIPNKDEATFANRRTATAVVIVVIWWNPFSGGGSAAPGAGSGAPIGGGPIGGPGI